MVWYDLSWTPQYFEHEGESSRGFLDVRITRPVEVTPEGYRYPGAEVPVTTPGTVYPITGLTAQKELTGQVKVGDVHMYTFQNFDIADNDEQTSDFNNPGVSTPGVRLYWHGDVYELVHKEDWSSAGVVRYTGRKRGRVPITPEPGGPS